VNIFGNGVLGIYPPAFIFISCPIPAAVWPGNCSICNDILLLQSLHTLQHHAGVSPTTDDG